MFDWESAEGQGAYYVFNREFNHAEMKDLFGFKDDRSYKLFIKNLGLDEYESVTADVLTLMLLHKMPCPDYVDKLVKKLKTEPKYLVQWAVGSLLRNQISSEECWCICDRLLQDLEHSQERYI